MKKTILILLALVMVLSLAACGSKSETTSTPAATEMADNMPESDKTVELTDEIIRSEKWVDLAYIEPDISFLDGGLVAYGDNLYDWELNGTTIRITGETKASLFVGSTSVNKAYVISEEAGIPKLTSITSSSIYVRESELETALNSFEIPEGIRIKGYDELVAKAETITIYELLHDVEENQSSAAQKYEGKPYIITTGYIFSIYNDYLLYDSFDKTNGKDTFTLGWLYVYMMNNDEFLSLNKGDRISFVGVITEVGNSVRMRNAYVYNG